MRIIGVDIGRQVLIPYSTTEAIGVQQAAKIGGVSPSTIRNWCEAHYIGRKIAAGPWRVSRPALLMLLDGNDTALKAYLSGVRDGEVRDYFDRATSQRIAEHIAQTQQKEQIPQTPQTSPSAVSRMLATSVNGSSSR